MSNLTFLMGSLARELRQVERDSEQITKPLMDEATDKLHGQAVQIANALADERKVAGFIIQDYLQARTEHEATAAECVRQSELAVASHVHQQSSKFRDLLQAIYNAQDVGRLAAADPINPEQLAE